MADSAPVLKGIIPPMITPLSGRDQLDHESTERVINHIIGGGVHGLFVLGSTGEAPSLPLAVQKEMIDLAEKVIAGRVPFLVGVTDTCYSRSLELARYSADHGVDAVVLAPPYYTPFHQDDLTRYFVEFAAECPLPVVLYNIPSHCKVAISLDSARQLMDVPNIIGFKDSSADMMYYGNLIKMTGGRDGFPLFMGPEQLLAESVLIGGNGGVCGGANLVPSLYVEMYDAAVAGDVRQVHLLQQRILRIADKLYGVGDPPSGYLKGVKCAMSHVGLCTDHMADPLHRLPDEKRDQIKRNLEELELPIEVAS
ncbi:MAG: dihydrodipicolinate synthase family protein [Planctomycetaceae bacterium]|nr:dihydrodipicolinate synthase family protein [Planctomycetaceae bacterium]